MRTNISKARNKFLDDALRALDEGEGKDLVTALSRCIALNEFQDMDVPVDALILAVGNTSGPILTRQ